MTDTFDLLELNKYYCHDEDKIHNLFLLCQKVLHVLEELVENNMYYTDVHTNNFVFYEKIGRAHV